MAKFKAGDKVLVDGKPGVVAEVATHDAHWHGAGEPQFYSVRLDSDFKPHEGCFRSETTGVVRGHQFDTLGGVAESRLAPAV